MRKNISIPRVLNEKVAQIANEKGENQSKIISNAIENYVEDDTSDIKERLDKHERKLEKALQEIKADLKRIRFAVNSVAMDTEVGKNLLNHLYEYNQITLEDFLQDAEEKSEVLIHLEKKVKAKILKAQQMKYS